MDNRRRMRRMRVKRRRKKILYVRPLKGMNHPVTRVPMVYIRWKNDGWFLLGQIAEHILRTTESKLYFHVWCAIGASKQRNPQTKNLITGNKAPHRLRQCRIELITHPEIKEQLHRCGVDVETFMRVGRRAIDLQGARSILMSWDAYGGKLTRLFESIGMLAKGTLETCPCGHGYKRKKTSLKRRRDTRVTQRERFHIAGVQGYACARCGDPIGQPHSVSYSGESHDAYSSSLFPTEISNGELIPFEVDHRLEFSRGGSNHTLNLRALCLSCHSVVTRRYFEKPFESYSVNVGTWIE